MLHLCPADEPSTQYRKDRGNRMTYLCIIFLPPAYFLTRKKWGGFCLNAVLYGLACLLVLTIALALGGFCFWAPVRRPRQLLLPAGANAPARGIDRRKNGREDAGNFQAVTSAHKPTS